MNITDLYADPVLKDEEKADLDTLAEKIQQGKVILFLGAAVHCPPPAAYADFYLDADRPPQANALALFLSNDLKFPAIAGKSLSWIAQLHEAKRTRRELIKVIDDALKDKKPSPLVKALAQMNFKYVLTTNYDDLFEQSLLIAGKELKNKGIYKPNKSFINNGNNIAPEPTENFAAELISAEAPFVYKIHGDIKAVYDENDTYVPSKDAIVITDEDYIHFILRMGEKDPIHHNNFNPIPTSFTKALADPGDITILFIGYSLMDYNLRLLFKSAIWKKDVQLQLRKWSVDLNPDSSIKALYGAEFSITFIEKDAWIVIPYLYEKVFNKVMPR